MSIKTFVPPERHQARDMTYSIWHRTLGPKLTMIDIDSLEYCAHCRTPLAFIETARETGATFKPTATTQAIAYYMSIPAYLVYYDSEHPPMPVWDGPSPAIKTFRVQRIFPWVDKQVLLNEDGYVAWLNRLRDTHTCTDTPYVPPPVKPAMLKDLTHGTE